MQPMCTTRQLTETRHHMTACISVSPKREVKQKRMTQSAAKKHPIHTGTSNSLAIVPSVMPT